MEQLTKKQIKFLNMFCGGKWEQTDKGIVVNGYVSMYDLGLKKIPVKFYKVEGYFWCSNNNLKNLEGCPIYVGGFFHCDNNNLKSLEGIGEVKGMIYCLYGNKINPKIEKQLRPEIFKKISLSTLQRMIAEY